MGAKRASIALANSADSRRIQCATVSTSRCASEGERMSQYASFDSRLTLNEGKATSRPSASIGSTRATRPTAMP